MPKTLQKADAANVLNAARELVGKMRSDAKDNEQIDGGMLDQLGGLLDVEVDTAEDGQSEMASADTGTGASTTTVSTPSTPSLPGSTELAKEGDSSTPSTPSAPTPSTPSSSSSTPEASMSTPTSEDKFGKIDEPMSTRPPSPSMIFDHAEDLRAQLPQFINLMMNNQLGKAQRLAGNGPAFDTMFNMACRAVMTEGGITYQNISKMHSGAPQNLDLNKAISAGDVPGVYLMRLAKLMLPLYAGLRRRLPADTPTTGSNQATWRSQLGFGALDFASMMSIAEAAIGDTPPTSFLTFNAAYRDTAINDAVTLKAIAAARGYDDPLQIAVIRAMTAVLQGEERNIIGSNYDALSVPVVTASGSTSGGTLAAGSYCFGVTALTYRGWLAKSVGDTTGSGAIGETNAGLSGSTAAVSLVIGSGSSVVLTWPAIAGAVAYNVYSGSTGQTGSAGIYLKTVTVNKCAVTAAASGSSFAPTTNKSANVYGYNGLINWAELTTVYSNTIAGKQTLTDNAGAGLTAENGGIKEFDAILEALWTNWQVTPSLIVCSPKMSKTITGKILSLNSASTYRIEVGNERGAINGAMMVTGYTNSFAPFADGSPRYLDILPHPYMPNGSLLFLMETIPYPMSRESRGFALDVLIPYTYFPLAQTTIQYPFALTLSEVLECFHPSAQTALVGVDEAL